MGKKRSPGFLCRTLEASQDHTFFIAYRQAKGEEKTSEYIAFFFFFFFCEGERKVWLHAEASHEFSRAWSPGRGLEVEAGAEDSVEPSTSWGGHSTCTTRPPWLHPNTWENLQCAASLPSRGRRVSPAHGIFDLREGLCSLEFSSSQNHTRRALRSSRLLPHLSR